MFVVDYLIGGLQTKR